MCRHVFRTELFFVALLWPMLAAAAELPTAQAILQIHQANKSRLSRLHLQLVQIEETTEAHCRKAQQDADRQEQVFKALSQTKPEEITIIGGDGKQLQGAELRQVIAQLTAQRQFVAALRTDVKPTRSICPMEFFTNGVDYQMRGPINSFNNDDELRAWTYSDAPMTPATL